MLGLIVRVSKGLMFPKIVPRQNKRDQWRGQALIFTKSLLIWRLGERRELWDEAKGRVVASKKTRIEEVRENYREGAQADGRLSLDSDGA